MNFNKEMLKFIVELTGNGHGTSPDQVFSKHGNTPTTHKELNVLERMGFIKVVWGSGSIFDILVQQKARDYFK